MNTVEMKKALGFPQMTDEDLALMVGARTETNIGKPFPCAAGYCY
jgi:hypothetical protein